MATYGDFCLGHLSHAVDALEDVLIIISALEEQSDVAQKRASGMLQVLVGPHEVGASCRLQVVYKACPASTQVLYV